MEAAYLDIDNRQSSQCGTWQKRRSCQQRHKSRSSHDGIDELIVNLEDGLMGSRYTSDSERWRGKRQSKCYDESEGLSVLWRCQELQNGKEARTEESKKREPWGRQDEALVNTSSARYDQPANQQMNHTSGAGSLYSQPEILKVDYTVFVHKTISFDINWSFLSYLSTISRRDKLLH